MQAAYNDAQREAFSAALPGLEPLTEVRAGPAGTPTTSVLAMATPRTPGQGLSPSQQRVEDKNQSTLNSQVRGRCVEEEETLLSMHEANIAYMQSKLAGFSARLQASLDAMRTCEDKFKWAVSSGLVAETLVERCGTALKPATVAEQLALGIPDVLPIRSTLQELSQTELSKTRLSQAKETLRKANAYSPTNVSDVAIGLYEFLHADVLAFAKDEISRTDQMRFRLIKKIESLETERDMATSAGNMAEAEQHHRAQIDAYQELLELLVSRVGQLTQSSTEATNFRSQMIDAQKDADDFFGQFRAHNTAMYDAIAQDLATLDKVRANERENNTDSINTHVRQTVVMFDALGSNERKQVALLKEMLEKARELEALQQHRAALVEAHLQAKETEEKRIVHYADFVAVLEQHTGKLMSARDQSDAALAISVSLQEYNGSMRTQLDRKRVDEELRSLSLEEGISLLNQYRRFVFTIGGFINKKRYRVESLQRQLRQIQLQQEMVAESLDPDADRYGGVAADIHAQIEECNATILHYQAILDAATNEFAPTEDLLKANEYEHEHPLVEFQEHSINERKKMLERARKFVEDEGREVEVQKEGIRKLQHAAVQERQALKAKAPVAE